LRKVALLSLKEQYKEFETEVLREMKRICSKQSFVLGENVRELEKEIANYCDAKYAVAVASGSDAILLALMAYDIGVGDKVITTPYTFFSTAGSIARLGAEPVFVDIEPDTFNIDPNAIERILKKDKAGKVKAIMPVHLFGRSANMTAIKKMASKKGMPIIEDAAQAIGTEYKGKRVGAIGNIGCFSFYPTKNLGGFGDGGMVTMNSKRLAEKIGMLHLHGGSRTYHHPIIGINSRLDELQAAVIRIKLKRLDKWTDQRIANAELYGTLFEKAGLSSNVTPHAADPTGRVVYNQYVIMSKNRNALRKHLTESGIGTGIYYPLPLHLQDCFKSLGYKRGDLPVSEKAARASLALPIYSELKKGDIKYVVDKIAEFYCK
jgi:dTDP-4-amino-4,6-dideoxygalactose transaminase